MSRARLGVAAGLAAWAAPALAAACPRCASTLPPRLLGLVGLFMLTPIAVFTVVALLLRRLDRQAGD